jgi:hypothetical protein
VILVDPTRKAAELLDARDPRNIRPCLDGVKRDGSIAESRIGGAAATAVRVGVCGIKTDDPEGIGGV